MSAEIEFESLDQISSPAAAAAGLRALAEQIENGTLQAGDGRITIPAEFFMKIELEEVQRDDGVFREIEVELKWPIQWKKTVTLPAEYEA